MKGFVDANMSAIYLTMAALFFAIGHVESALICVAISTLIYEIRKAKQ